MDDRRGFKQGLDSHRHSSSALLSPFKSLAHLATGNGGGKKNVENEPIHAALGKDLDETIPTISDGILTRNRALLHYIATLAVSNSEEDEFNYEFVQSLLDGGADINKSVDVHGQTIFHEVARSWNLDVATFLLKNGANINQQDKFGRSPLHVCAAADHADMVEFLLQRGADVDSRSTGDEQTPLHFAAKNDATLSLKALLGFGANIDSLDYRGRSPLQVAAESSRAATARILIEEGASSCIYDLNGSSAMTVLTEKLPNLAIEALDQLHVSDTLTRRELFYLNLLEESRLKKETKKARTPLETVVNGRQFDVLMHPVMQRLVAIKWDQYGKIGTMLDLMMNLVYAILFTVFAVETPGEGEELYLPSDSKAWRIFLGLVLILLNAYMMYVQIRTTINARKKQNSWMKWRIQQLKDDLQYCHPRWQEEKYVKDEMRLIKRLPSLSTVDAWFVFDWFITVVFIVAFGLNLAYFLDGSNSVKSAYTYVISVLVILVWLRILKYLRPFPGIGTLVLILGAIIGDFVTWGFFYLLLFIPFTASFWIIFGGNAVEKVPSYAKTQRLAYTMIQMSVGEDFDLEGLVEADAVMARLLSGLYLVAMVIVCLNILIAYLSNTFTSVYSKAVENTSMQRAINVLNMEKFLTKKRRDRFFRYMREHASPEAVSSLALSIFDKRQSEKDGGQLQKDFKKTHGILIQRFSKTVGRSKISAFDVLLQDVEKLKRLQNNTVTDLRKIQSGLEELGDVVFGQRNSPVRGFFRVDLSQNVAFERSSRRMRSEEEGQSSPPVKRTRAASTYVKQYKESESRATDEDDKGSKSGRQKKTSITHIVPKVSIFSRNRKNRMANVEFAEDELREESAESQRSSSRPRSSSLGERAPRSRSRSPRHVQGSGRPVANRDKHSSKPRHGQSSSAQNSLDVVPSRRDNDGYDEENDEEFREFSDPWESLSADRVSL